jgi:hypothetical protein
MYIPGSELRAHRFATIGMGCPRVQAPWALLMRALRTGGVFSIPSNGISGDLSEENRPAFPDGDFEESADDRHDVDEERGQDV